MMTINEVSKKTGLSIRTLQYYDSIDLLKPCGYTDAGYRLYDEKCLEKLSEIMLFRELEFSLSEIKEIMKAACYDKQKALDKQIELLEMKKEHLEGLIAFAKNRREKGKTQMSFDAFDSKKIEEYKKRAKEQWGNTKEYIESIEKTKNWTKDEEKKLAEEFMQIFAEFGQMMNEDPASDKVQSQVKKLQDYIIIHFYNCTKEILNGLGTMYAAGGEFTDNIDKAGGKGTAEFVNKAIAVYCR